ncbi:thioredoxin family protein [Halpernia sp.]|uniref:thioredoxin family protein n=1 Tax=Halpernia sp. TaxID=2782209 RepID=UPI003A945443
MRKFIVLLFILTALFFNAQVKWMSFSEAMTQQKIQPKKIIIDFYTDWCKPCKTMDVRTYGNPFIAAYINEHFYAVKFEADGNEQLNYLGKQFGNTKSEDKKSRKSLNDFTMFMNVSSIPSTVFLDEKSYPITNLNGYLSAKELEVYLNMIATNDYKKIKTKADWEAYTKKLQSKIKE